MFHIKQVIIIAGPSCAGKTFLIDKIKQNALPELRNQLGLSDPSSWQYVLAMDLDKVCQSSIDKLVIHYDLFEQQSKENEFNYLNKLISNSDMLTVVSLLAPRSVLMKRIRYRIFGLYLRKFGLRKKEYPGQRIQKCISILQKKYRACQCGGSDVLYDRWFSYLNKNSVSKHFLIDSTKSYTTNISRHEPIEQKKIGVV